MTDERKPPTPDTTPADPGATDGQTSWPDEGVPGVTHRNFTPAEIAAMDAVREKIEVGWRQSERGEMIPGDVAMERLRARIKGNVNG